MVGAAALKAVQDILSFVSPLLLRQMICFTKLEDMNAYYGYLWAIMMFVVAVLQSLALQQVCALCAFYFPVDICGGARSSSDCIPGTVHRNCPFTKV
jgi:Mn2+/Fe2+ NRAMP family transporter